MTFHYTDIDAYHAQNEQAEQDKIQSDFLKLYYHEKDKSRPRTMSELMKLADSKRKRTMNFEFGIFIGMIVVLPFTPLIISYLRSL